jgi:hypothetical protein
MVSTRELATTLTRLAKSRKQKAREIPGDLRIDFFPGYVDALQRFGDQFGIGCHGTGEYVFQVEPGAGAEELGPIAPGRVASALARLRADLHQFEEEDRRERVEGQIEGYFIGYRRALGDIAQELGQDDK